MNVLQVIQQRLAVKVFLSYVVILLVGGGVIVVTSQIHAASIELNHSERVKVLLAQDPALEDDLQNTLRDANNQVVLMASLAAFVTSLFMSTFVTRRIVEPIRQMKVASERIAAGDYDHRIWVPSEDEVGALAQAFNRMTETIEQTEQRRLELIGNVAHELRTPLSSMRVVMEGLVDGVLPADASTFNQVQREFARLDRLVQDLQELSRVESDSIRLNRQPVDMVERIQTAVTRLRPQFEDKGIGLNLNLPDHLPDLLADRDRIMQVLVNLLGNALHYTPSGGQVAVQAESHGHELLVSVIDTGIGIAPEHLDHLFERFYRVDKSRSRVGGGSGIGLTISKHLIEDHGGRIWASSPGPGLGSTFAFALPVSFVTKSS